MWELYDMVPCLPAIRFSPSLLSAMAGFRCVWPVQSHWIPHLGGPMLDLVLYCYCLKFLIVFALEALTFIFK